MRVRKIKCAAIFLFTVAPLSCQLGANHGTTSKEGIPFEFEAKGSNGELIRSKDLERSSILLVFFNIESVAAWRALSQIEKAVQKYGHKRPSILAVGRPGLTSTAEHINDLKEEFSILSPIIFDQDNRISKSFKVPDCCDYLYSYAPGWVFRTSQPLAASYTQIDELVKDLFQDQSKNAYLPESDEKAELNALLATLRSSGIISRPAQNRLTVLNIFSGMCEGCATGKRLETLNALSSNFGDKLSVVSIFSKGDFSDQDLENLRKILKPNHETLLKEIDGAEIYLLNGRLLIVFDPRGGSSGWNGLAFLKLMFTARSNLW